MKRWLILLAMGALSGCGFKIVTEEEMDKRCFDCQIAGYQRAINDKKQVSAPDRVKEFDNSLREAEDRIYTNYERR